MAYEKQNFTSGQVLTADHMNKIEEGICQVESKIPTHDWDSLDGKPFWDSEESVVLFDGVVTSDNPDIVLSEPIEISENTKLTITVNGFTGTYGAGEDYVSGVIYIVTYFNDNDGKGYRLCWSRSYGTYSGCKVTFPTAVTEIELKIEGVITKTTQLDSKFIGDDIARVADIPEVPEHTWASLPDKPFDIQCEVIEIEFDGDSNAKETVDFYGQTYVKVSDEILTINELNGSVFKMESKPDKEQNIIFEADYDKEKHPSPWYIKEFNEFFFGASVPPKVACVTQDTTYSGVSFTQGLWFWMSSSDYTNYFRYTKTETTQLDSKFIGDDIMRVSNHTWESVLDKPFDIQNIDITCLYDEENANNVDDYYYVSDVVVPEGSYTVTEFLGTFDDDEVTIAYDESGISAHTIFDVYCDMCFVKTPNTTFDGKVFPAAGIYATSIYFSSARTEVRAGRIYGEQINTLDSKFIGDDIARVSDIPKSALVPDAAGETPTAAEFNALLQALKDAGLMTTE